MDNHDFGLNISSMNQMHRKSLIKKVQNERISSKLKFIAIDDVVVAIWHTYLLYTSKPTEFRVFVMYVAPLHTDKNTMYA